MHLEIPDGVSVPAELFQGDDDDDMETFRVQHLPPMSLTCIMPLSYPSHHPPYFTISVHWLDSVKNSSLCQMLDSIWHSNLDRKLFMIGCNGCRAMHFRMLVLVME